MSFLSVVNKWHKIGFIALCHLKHGNRVHSLNISNQCLREMSYLTATVFRQRSSYDGKEGKMVVKVDYSRKGVQYLQHTTVIGHLAPASQGDLTSDLSLSYYK